MSTRTRALVVGAMLAVISLAGMTTARAQATDEPPRQDVRRPPTQGQVGEPWHRLSPTYQQPAAGTALERVQAPESVSIPDATPAEPTAPAPTQPNRPPAWLLVCLGVLAVLMLVAVLAARRASRRARLGQPA